MKKPVNYGGSNVNQICQQNISNTNQPIVKHKKNKLNIMIAISSIVVIVLLVFCIAYFLGYVPIGLSVIEPVGNAKTVNIENLLKEFPSMAGMPNLDKIEYKAFDTDASVGNVIKSYESRLFIEGYSRQYSGAVELNGKTFHVYGYLKGLTAVGILTSDEIIENYNSLVLYATGNALDFREILDWYKNN